MLDEKLLKAGLELSKTTKDFYGDILNRMVGICKKAEEDLDLDFDLMLEDLSNLIYALVLISKLGSKDGYFDLDELANMAYFSYFNHE
jgi:tetrapyrrole methylase